MRVGSFHYRDAVATTGSVMTIELALAALVILLLLLLWAARSKRERDRQKRKAAVSVYYDPDAARLATVRGGPAAGATGAALAPSFVAPLPRGAGRTAGKGRPSPPPVPAPVPSFDPTQLAGPAEREPEPLPAFDLSVPAFRGPDRGRPRTESPSAAPPPPPPVSPPPAVPPPPDA